MIIMTLEEKVKEIYKVMPKANFALAHSVEIKDQLDSKEWLRMTVGDIDATLECEGYSKRMELELLKYVNLLYSKL
jgi:hypothetical protein